MTKLEFLDSLKARLASLPQSEIYRLMGYYAEMIDDRIESGMSEAEAVAALGPMDSIIESIMYDMSIPKLMRAKVKESKNKVGNRAIWIILVIVTFPFWLPALMAFFGVVFGLFMAIWGIILALFAVVASLGISGVACVAGGAVLLFVRSVPAALCSMGAGFVLIGITMFLIKPITYIAKWLGKGIAALARRVKSLFFRKKEAI